ncbi:hypothetical protein LSH36_827g00023 [Paralvinella palmiformis]|uniref:Uncharacterized protein n=1 Tax=Paralvinella palmiformis TaxID=53620 RepID=A0AAD9IZ22_9ANNE|nr:hypothetical protein LSH36_827g00023 [Paralvinella palmiformis]
MSEEKIQIIIEDGCQPPPYDTIINIPDRSQVPSPPAYSAPVVKGVSQTEDVDYPPPPYVEEAYPKPNLPQLAYADFLPRCISLGDIPEYDDMRIDYDTRNMDFTMGSGDTTFVKVIRVPFVKASSSTNLYLTSKTFVPVRFGGKESETTSQTMARVNQWLNYTGAKVIGIDTLEYEISIQNHNPVDVNNARSTVMKTHSHYWISTIRLYIDGPFIEPSEEVCPPIPAFGDYKSKNRSSTCCCLV